MTREQQLASLKEKGITTKEGLLWQRGRMLGVFEADRVAEEHDLMFAERVVRLLEESKT